jgi:hypothetical protein
LPFGALVTKPKLEMKMAKKTETKLAEALIEMLSPLSDININDNNEVARERYEPSTEWMNRDLKGFIDYNLLNPITRPYTDKRGVRGSAIDRAKMWKDKAEADARATVHAYQHPGDDDSRPTLAAVNRDCARADKARTKYEVLCTWEQVLQTVHLELLGYFSDDNVEAEISEDVLNRYGNAG